MNGIEHRESGQSGPDDVAIAWFARLRSPELDEAERAEFERWIAADPAHAAAFAEVEALWQDLGQVEDRGAASVTPIRPETGGETNGRRVSPDWRWLTAAAALVLAVGGILFFAREGGGPELQTFASGATQPLTVHLEDGSSIYLFENSSITVAMNDSARDVSLERGAGVFDVAHDPARGFTVRTTHGIVKVVGTVFDVHTDPDQSTITVISGAVIVGFEEDRGGPEFTLEVGSRASYSRTGKTAVSHGAAPTLKFVRTATDQLVFEDIELEALVSELNEHFERKLWLGSDELKKLKVSAVLDLTDEDSVLRGIERAIDVKAVAVSGKLVVFNVPGPGEAPDG